MNKQAFTLIELLVVVAIVGILAAIIVISMSGANNSARDAVRKVDVNQLAKSLAIYKTNNPEASLPEVTCNIGDDCSVDVLNVLGSASILRDADSSKHYVYSSNGDDFVISSKLTGDTDYCFDSSTGKYGADGCVGFASGPTCPTGWIEIPGTSNCVMKYEAKIQGNDEGYQAYDSAFVAESRASGTPWNNITSYQAKDECTAIGAHLITNAEWMTIARNIENNSAQNENASGELYRGNSSLGSGSYNGHPASTDDNDGYYMVSSNDIFFNIFGFKLIDEVHAVASQMCSLDSSTQRRTFILSNGAVIWDFAGNAAEYTSAVINATQLPAVNGCVEFKDIVDWGSLNSGDIQAQNVNKIGIGNLCFYSYLSGELSYIRGGHSSSCFNGGPYSISFFSSNDLVAFTGFRCVKPKA